MFIINHHLRLPFVQSDHHHITYNLTRVWKVFSRANQVLLRERKTKKKTKKKKTNFRLATVNHSASIREDIVHLLLPLDASDIMPDVEWSSASCSKCSGHGTIAAREGFTPCDACGGCGKVTSKSCCNAHADTHGIDDGHGHGHGHMPRTLKDLMANLDLEDEHGLPVEARDAFKDKVVGLYFSASHCPGCVKFSPTLSGLTESHASDLCTVLVSGDKDEESAARSSEGKGFLRVPFDSPHRGLLMRAFGVFAIPVLVRLSHPAPSRHGASWGQGGEEETKAGGGETKKKKHTQTHTLRVRVLVPPSG